MTRPTPTTTLIPYTTLFRSSDEAQQSLRDARLLRDALIKKGWRSGKDLDYFEAEGAEHNEGAWAARVERILDRKSTRLNSSHTVISYAVFCLKKKKQKYINI